MHELEPALARIRGAWMTGTPAAEACPPAWRPVVGDGGQEAELRLLALVGQAMQVSFRPAAEAIPPPRPLLPDLPLPTVPAAVRPHFRRALARDKTNPFQLGVLLEILAVRGWSAHPADVLPLRDRNCLPDLYAPWLDWSLQAAGRHPADEPLTTETWSDWRPAERRVRLETMRRAEPAAARTLIAANIASEGAEERLRLLEVLADGLVEDDAAFLESLGTDRSAKVRELAEAMLGHLGLAAHGPALAAELAAFLSVGRTAIVFGSRTVCFPRPPREADRLRAGSLASLVPYPALAAAVGLTEIELIEAWQFGNDYHIESAMVGMVARTGSDAAAARLAERIAAAPRQLSPDVVRQLHPRLSAVAGRAIVLALLSVEDPTLNGLSRSAGGHYGTIPFAPIAASPAYSALLDNLRDLQSPATAAPRHRRRTSPDSEVRLALEHFGLLADRPAAAAILAAVTAAGLPAADPQLAMLAFNAALEERPDRD